MLDDFENGQPIAYRILTNKKSQNQFSHAYLFETNDYPEKLAFVYSFVKYILCPKHYSNKVNCGKCTQCYRIDAQEFSEIYYIEPDGMWIKKSQLQSLQEEFEKTAIESQYRVYIINGAERLNVAAANSILKFLEEPEPNIIAILLSDYPNQILETITSRCQIIPCAKMTFSDRKKKYPTADETLLQLLPYFIDENQSVDHFLSQELLLNQLESIVKFVAVLEDPKQDPLILAKKLFHDIFQEKKDIEIAFDLLILFYRDVIHSILNQPIKLFQKYELEIKRLASYSNFDILCRKIEYLLDQKEMIKYNLNISLLIDKLIITFKGM